MPALTLDQMWSRYYDANAESAAAFSRKKNFAFSIADALTRGETPDETAISNYRHWSLRYAVLCADVDLLRVSIDAEIAERNKPKKGE